MNLRYMLVHKLHFVTVHVAHHNLCNINYQERPTILYGSNVLKYLDITTEQATSISTPNEENLEWHYWSRSNLHRYANIDIGILTHNIAQQYNILNTSNAILALNFDDEHILQQNLAVIQQNIQHNNTKTYTEIAVIASFKHMQEKEYLNYKAKIILFEPSTYNIKTGNIHKYYKDGVCIKNYINVCRNYAQGKYTKNIQSLNYLIDELNANINLELIHVPSKLSDDECIKFLQNKKYTYDIKQQILTESFLDYEGSTGIDFVKLYNSGILPQEMVYFNKDNKTIHVNTTTPLCTYAIIEHAYSNKWTANGGIALHLHNYLDNKQLLDVSTQIKK